LTGNASATVNNIAASELLFRFGMVGDLADVVILIFLVLAFYMIWSRMPPYAFARTCSLA
jgi:hypothetical protein